MRRILRRNPGENLTSKPSEISWIVSQCESGPVRGVCSTQKEPRLNNLPKQFAFALALKGRGFKPHRKLHKIGTRFSR
jgi:hypothetical protein